MSEAEVIRPAVAVAKRPMPASLGLLGATALGLIVFASLDSNREAKAQSLDAAAAGMGPGLASPVPQPLPVVAPPPAPPVMQAPPPAPIVPTPAPPPVMAQPVDRSAIEARLRAPALIVDLSEPPQRVQLAQVDAAQAATPAAAAAAAAARAGTNDTERFASRVGAERPESVGATVMGPLDRIVAQGATVEAVMETAIDSDLPGFARAVVSRDVLSFDGSTVLIPRGSKVIGQYKSGVALGASRVFVIWQRLIRPDGVSVMLASPATDELGRGGLGGKVDRHFLQRFGGAILLSVIDGGLAAGTAALSNGNSTGVYIGSATQATSVATDALRATDIPPTIRTKPGASVRIFVARDLDFTAVGPMQ